MITGIETSTQADQLYKEAKTLFQCVSMNLCEWASNSSEFLQNIPECDRASAETVEVRGSPWNLTTDTIFINGSHNLSFKVTTRREALQYVSRIYDPLGLFFSSHSECKAVHSGPVETRKRLATRHSVSYSNKNGTR